MDDLYGTWTAVALTANQSARTWAQSTSEFHSCPHGWSWWAAAGNKLWMKIVRSTLTPTNYIHGNDVEVFAFQLIPVLTCNWNGTCPEQKSEPVNSRHLGSRMSHLDGIVGLSSPPIASLSTHDNMNNQWKITGLASLCFHLAASRDRGIRRCKSFPSGIFSEQTIQLEHSK